MRCILEAYEVTLGVDVANYIEIGGTNLVALISYFLFYCCAMWWLYKKKIFARENPSLYRKEMTDGEYQTFSYIAILVVGSIADIGTNAFLGSTSWFDASEAALVSYTFIQFVVNVLMTGFNQ